MFENKKSEIDFDNRRIISNNTYYLEYNKRLGPSTLNMIYPIKRNFVLPNICVHNYKLYKDSLYAIYHAGSDIHIQQIDLINYIFTQSPILGTYNDNSQMSIFIFDEYITLLTDKYVDKTRKHQIRIFNKSYELINKYYIESPNNMLIDNYILEITSTHIKVYDILTGDLVNKLRIVTNNKIKHIVSDSQISNGMLCILCECHKNVIFYKTEHLG